MKQLREHIRKEITNLMEKKYPATPEIINTLKQIFQGPLVRYVDNLKAVNTIPPSYRVFLKEGGKYFDLYFEKVSIVLKIGAKKYWLMNDDEVLLAQQEINRLLTQPTFNVQGDEETEGGSGDTGGGGGSASDTTFEPDPEEEGDEEGGEEAPEPEA